MGGLKELYHLNRFHPLARREFVEIGRAISLFMARTRVTGGEPRAVANRAGVSDPG